MSGRPGGDDAALREAFAELERAERAGAPSLARLMARPRPQSAPSARARRRSSASSGAPRGLVPRLAAVSAVVVAAAAGVWLGRSPGVPEPVESLAGWQAATDFLLDTPAAALLGTTPEIPGPLPPTLATPGTPLPTGETR